VFLQEVEVARRLQAFGEGRRVFEIREEDRPKRRRHLGLVGGIFDLSEEAQDCILRGVDDLGRNEAVRLGVGLRHVLRGRSACEAEGRSQVWIEPVGEKGHVVLAGDLQVLGMGARHVLGSHPGKVVSVEVERHRGANLAADGAAQEANLPGDGLRRSPSIGTPQDIGLTKSGRAGAPGLERVPARLELAVLPLPPRASEERRPWTERAFAKWSFRCLAT